MIIPVRMGCHLSLLICQLSKMILQKQAKHVSIAAMDLGFTHRFEPRAAPNVPTLDEQGVAGYSTESWNGLFAPKGTPRAIINRLAAIAAAIARDDAIQRHMAEFGSVAVANSPEDYARMLREETAQWADLVKQIGLK